MIDLTLSAGEAALIGVAATITKCDWLHLEDADDTSHAIDLENDDAAMETYDAIIMVCDAFGEDPALHIGAKDAAELEALRQKALQAEKAVKTIGYNPYMFDLDFETDDGMGWRTVRVIGDRFKGTVISDGWFKRPFKPACASYAHVAEAALLALAVDPDYTKWVIRRIWEPVGQGAGVMSFR